jgi:hypothetical protein
VLAVPALFRRQQFGARAASGGGFTTRTTSAA